MLLLYTLLATTVMLVVVHDLKLFVKLVAFQALVLAVHSALLAWQDADPALWWAAGLTLFVKALAIPVFLHYVIRRIRVVRVIDSLVSSKMALLIALTLMIVAHYATAALPGGGPAAEALPAALTMVLIGVFLMVSRRVALTQVLGLLVMENGLFLAALASSGGLPLLVDAGIFFDVLVSVIICGLLIYRISATFASIDTHHLRRLRG